MQKTAALLLALSSLLLPLPDTIAGGENTAADQASPRPPNVLFIITDQQRFDTIRALGNTNIYTPNLDRLARRGVAFVNAYAQCPVCTPSRYTIHTGCESRTTREFQNGRPHVQPDEPKEMTNRCGPYLPTVMKQLGYRTFGIGKFHTIPWNEPLGYEVQLYGEELYGSAAQRRQDAYAAWIAKEHGAFDYLEGLRGERTEMYYEPQRSSLPAAFTIETWAADQAVEQIKIKDGRPYFGYVSFIGPHPPFAPPIPFNRMYDPDRMPDPISGDPATDYLDEQIPWMNHAVWAEDINNPQARILKARYYDEISYVDHCLGRILDAVEKGKDGSNTLICFTSDHGDLLGDHRGWQKECYFEGACHIPFLVSWPAQISAGQTRDDLVCLTDLFGIATHAAGKTQLREGVDVLGALKGGSAARDYLFGYYGEPGTARFKIMARHGDWKYIFIANGGREQLFDLKADPHELKNLVSTQADVAAQLCAQATSYCDRPELQSARDSGRLRPFPFQARPPTRIYQFDASKGVTGGFPKRPEDALTEAD